MKVWPLAVMVAVREASVLFGAQVNKISLAPSDLAILAKLTLTGVSPDPETITSPSPLRIDGAVSSIGWGSYPCAIIRGKILPCSLDASRNSAARKQRAQYLIIAQRLSIRVFLTKPPIP